MGTDDQAIIPGRYGGHLTPVRDSESGTALGRIRWEKRAEAVRQGLQDAAEELTQKSNVTLPDGTPLKDEYDLMRVAAAAHGLNAADPSAPSSVQSLNAVDRMAFPAPERAVWEGVPPGGAQLNISAELAQKLLSAMREERA